jgi:hypothetical protein
MKRTGVTIRRTAWVGLCLACIAALYGTLRYFTRERPQPLSLASDDINRDGFPDLVTGYRWASGGLTEVASFYAYDPSFIGGVFVGVGDVTGDGVAEIVTGSGVGGGPRVRAFSLVGGAASQSPGR